jgi:serine protease Do
MMKAKTQCQKISFTAWVVTVSVLMSISLSSTSYAALMDSSAGQMVPASFTDLAKQTSPSVVNISTVKTIKSQGRVFRHFFGGPQGPEGQEDPFDQFFKHFNVPPGEFKQNSLGSGFIIDTQGYIITNNHVISDADEIKVKLKDGKEFDAQIVGKDPTTDIALLKIKPTTDLPVLTLGDSNKLEIGQWVVAIGNPFGLADTVTAGIVSAKGRVIGAGPYDDFIQTDASINPGNSGGPLIDLQGEVVGINTAILAGGGGGIGFAIPINMAKDIIDQLKKNGEVSRGWLGVAIQDLDEELKGYYKVDSGVLVTEVFADDPADKAGIKANDIIVSVNGTPVNSSRELSRLIAAVPVGDKADLKINRNGDMMTKKIAVAKRDETKLAAMGQGSGGEQPEQSSGPLGLQVSNITPEIAQQLQLKNTDGVIVMDVDADSKAALAGFSRGDIIKEVNHKLVKNLDEFKKDIDAVKQGESLEFLVKGANKGFSVIKLTK